MIFPDIQLRAEKMGAAGWLIGTMLASTFVVQLIASPQWGRLSDRLGRKPVLVTCSALSAAGLFVYGVAASIPLLLLSRVVSGLGGANVAIAQALVSDGTPEAERTVEMGRLGAAISLGLIAGPVAGGFLGHVSGLAVGMSAGASSGLGALLIVLFVRANPRLFPSEESSDSPRKRRGLFDLALLRELKTLRALVIVAAVAWFSLAMLEGTFGRLIEKTLQFDQRQFGIVFGYESMLGFLVQAFFIARIAKRVRDDRLLRMSYVLQGLGLGLTPFTYLFPVAAGWLGILLFFSTLYAVGSGFANPTLNSLCSKIAPPDRQGELFGLLQGARSIGFVIGPILGGALFDVGFALPYLFAAVTCVVAALLVPPIA